MRSGTWLSSMTNTCVGSTIDCTFCPTRNFSLCLSSQTTLRRHPTHSATRSDVEQLGTFFKPFNQSHSDKATNPASFATITALLPMPVRHAPCPYFRLFPTFSRFRRLSRNLGHPGISVFAENRIPRDFFADSTYNGTICHVRNVLDHVFLDTAVAFLAVEATVAAPNSLMESFAGRFGLENFCWALAFWAIHSSRPSTRGHPGLTRVPAVMS
jgi:hypothetical protein